MKKMLNNEFKLMGVVVSDFEEVGTDKFSKKKMYIEVERKGGRGAQQHPIIIYGSNRDIDTEMSYKGKTIIINGYVDTWKSYITLVAQELFVLGAVDDTEIEGIEPAPLPVDEEEKSDIEEIYDKKPKLDESLEVSDDDLPF